MSRQGHIWLLGLSGSGKTTIGPLLAKLLDLPFQDTDEMIVRTAKRPIPDIFSTEGEPGFRQRETRVIHDLEKQSPAVVACGGGAVLLKANRDCMHRTGVRVYLRIPLGILNDRLKQKKDRPLLLQGDLTTTLSDQLNAREPWYQESEIQIDADQDSPARVAQQIFQRLSIDA